MQWVFLIPGVSTLSSHGDSLMMVSSISWPLTWKGVTDGTTLIEAGDLTLKSIIHYGNKNK